MVTDWLMVVITAIYVGATVLILRANNRSAKATKEQLDESRKQYDEAKRLEHRPYFSLKLLDDCAEDPIGSINIDLCQDYSDGEKTYVYFLLIQNIGIGTAKEIKCGCENGDETFNIEHFPFETALPHEKYTIVINTLDVPILKEGASRQFYVKLHFEYSDLLENKYSQVLMLIFMQFSDGLILLDQWTSPPTIIE